MRYTDFEDLVERLWAEVPREFLDGIAAVEISRKALPHPIRAGVYTLGECIPLPVEAGPGAETVQSRVVLYHGSFVALARTSEGFVWREEVWETLTHELRHHLEWRARAPDLEQIDWAAEQNFARGDGEPFNPDFYLDAERVAEGVYRLDDDFFLEQTVLEPPAEVSFVWHGAQYAAPVPEGARLPVFLTVEQVDEPPPGELVVVLRLRRRLSQIFRRAVPFLATATARPVTP